MRALDSTIDALVDAAMAAGARGSREGVRRFIEGVGWMLRTGAPWRDLPERFGLWNSAFRRFRRWVSSGRWSHVVQRQAEPTEWVLLDSTIIKAHPDAAGARGSCAEAEALGRSRGGFTTKVHAAVSSTGRWLTSCLTPGQDADVRFAIPLLQDLSPSISVVADRAYDSNALLEWLAERGSQAVIPARKNRRAPRELARDAYAVRNVIERFFGRLKRLRRVGTRYDKTASSFAGFVAFAARVVEQTSWS